MNILNTRKPFSSVLPGEEIYYIDPQTQLIRSTTITASAVHPKSLNRFVWMIKFYMPFRIDSITKEALEEAKKFGTNVEQTMYINRNECMVITQTDIPMAFATEKKYLEEWKNNKSGLIAPKRNA